MSKGGSSSSKKKSSSTPASVGTGVEPRYPVGVTVDPLPVNQSQVLASQLAGGYGGGGGPGAFQAALEGMYRPTQYTQLSEPITQTARALGLEWSAPGTFKAGKGGFNPNKFDIPGLTTNSSFIDALLQNKVNGAGGITPATGNAKIDKMLAKMLASGVVGSPGGTMYTPNDPQVNGGQPVPIPMQYQNWMLPK